jgi:copper chaperone CopZ
MRSVVVPVAGLHCEGCTRTLSLALMRLDGVLDARADLAAGQVRVRFDDTVLSEAQVRDRIEAIGFGVAATGGGAA